MNLVIQSVVMFLIGFCTDIIWVLYIQNVADKKRVAAANYSVMTGICGILWVEGLLSNVYLMVFWLAGMWIGTYFADQIESFVKRLIK